MAILSYNPTEFRKSDASWGNGALVLEFFSFATGRVTAYLIFVDHGPHRVLGSLFVLALVCGLIAAILAAVGLCRDKAKWPGILAAVLFPLTFIYTV